MNATRAEMVVAHNKCAPNCGHMYHDSTGAHACQHRDRHDDWHNDASNPCAPWICPLISGDWFSEENVAAEEA